MNASHITTRKCDATAMLPCVRSKRYARKRAAKLGAPKRS